MRGVLIDLDGVIWENDQVVRGAVESIDWLNAERIPYLFLTNTTSRPVRLIADKLCRLGIHAEQETILTPPIAACAWLTSHAPGPTLLLAPPATREDFATIDVLAADSIDAPVAVVVGDIGEAWDYALLNGIFQRLMTPNPPQLIALGMTRYWRGRDGLRLDVAPFIKALEHAADCEAVVLGKPSKNFFDIALESIGCAAIDTVMLGDDLMTDVLGAQEAGLQGVLTRTGKFRPQDLETGVMPDAMLDSIAELPDWWGS